MLFKKARNSVALIMAAVLVLCSFAICDFTAFAKIPIETTTAEFDFSEGFANGAPTVNNRVGEGQISFFQYRSSGYETYNASGIYHERNNGAYSNYYSEPYVGCFEEDGLVFIDNLKNYIKDDKILKLPGNIIFIIKAFRIITADIFLSEQNSIQIIREEPHMILVKTRSCRLVMTAG